MPAVSGSFSGNVKVQTAIALSDQMNHELNLAEIRGPGLRNSKGDPAPMESSGGTG
jgi:hypothetical protein